MSISEESKLSATLTDLENENFTHEELLEITRRTVNDLVSSDQYLKELPADVTPDEVISAIAVHYGQSITVFIKREDGLSIPVTVPQRDSTVLDLKKRIRTATMLHLRRQNIFTKISWRYVWRTYCLSFHGTKLKKDSAKLHEIGIKNHSKLKYVKKLRDKVRVKDD